MSYSVRLLGPEDAAVLDTVDPDVFDYALDQRWTAEFLADPRHHLAVALAAGQVVGMASAVHYVHPDKRPELWINEVGVATAHHRRGLGQQLVRALLDHGRTLGCQVAWVLTEQDNLAARGLYAAAGGVEAAEPVVFVEFDLH